MGRIHDLLASAEAARLARKTKDENSESYNVLRAIAVTNARKTLANGGSLQIAMAYLAEAIEAEVKSLRLKGGV